MAEQHPPADDDIAKIKRAMHSAGVLKSAGLSAAEETQLRQHLEHNGIDTRRFPISFKIICHSGHYCLIIRGL